MMCLLMVTRSGVAVDVVAGNMCDDELWGGNDHWKTSRKPEHKAFEGLCRWVLMLHIFEVRKTGGLGPRSASHRPHNPFPQL